MKRIALVLLAACGVETAPPPPQITVDTPPPPMMQQEQPLTGFPCDVRAVLQNNCANCHAGQTYMPALRTRDDLLGPATTIEGLTRGAAAVKLVDAGKMPPPYTQPPTTDEINVLAAWVQAGMPGGACSALTAP